MASSSTGDSAPAARLAKLLDACPSALLVFDDRTTLAMSKELLMLQSPVLPGAIIFAYKEQCVSQVRVALPGDRRADWVTALPFLYGVECEVTWDTAGTLAGLLQKYELSALRTAVRPLPAARGRGRVAHGFGRRHLASLCVELARDRGQLPLGGECGAADVQARCGQAPDRAGVL